MKKYYALILTIFFISPSYGGCPDPARPGVDWQRCYLDGQKLKNIDLSGKKTRLRDTSFNRGDLSGANLSEVDAYHAKFVSAMLIKTNFKQADLTEADFSRADLTGANLTGAKLVNAKLFRVKAKGAIFKDADMKNANLLHGDFTGATWTDGRICKEGSIGRCN
jgi:uncharacterized protein YjbI with pentapeptide repeats